MANVPEDGVPCPHGWRDYSERVLDGWTCAVCGARATRRQVTVSRWTSESGPALSRLHAALRRHSPMGRDQMKDVLKDKDFVTAGFARACGLVRSLDVARKDGCPSESQVERLLDPDVLQAAEAELEEASLRHASTCWTEGHPGRLGPVDSCPHPDCVVRSVLQG